MAVARPGAGGWSRVTRLVLFALGPLSVLVGCTPGVAPSGTQDPVATPVPSVAASGAQSAAPTPVPEPVPTLNPGSLHVRISRTLSLADDRHIDNPGGYPGLQSGVFDGAYIYASFNSQEGGRIVKVDVKTGVTVQTSEVLAIGHANAMGYDSKNRRLVIAARNYDTNTDVKKLFFVKTADLTIDHPASATTAQVNSGLICYDQVNDRYVIGGGTLLGVYDGKFHKKKMIVDWEGMGNTLGLKQAGGFCDARRIYFTGSIWGGGTAAEHNAILVFDWNGHFVDGYYIQPPAGHKLEIEGGFLDRFGQAYVFYNDFNSATGQNGYARVDGLVSGASPG